MDEMNISLNYKKIYNRQMESVTKEKMNMMRVMAGFKKKVLKILKIPMEQN